MDDCLIICQYKTEEPKNIKILTPIFVEIWLFWYETGVLSLDPKWLPSEHTINSTGLKM